MAVNSFNAQNPPVTTKGDLFTFSTIPTRLGVGSNNQVLTADSSTATGLKWATAASGGMTEIASGSLSGTSTTLSSIPGTYKHLFLTVRDWQPSTANSLLLKPNNTSTGHINYWGSRGTSGNGNAVDINLSAAVSSTNTATDNYCGVWIYDYASAVAAKSFEAAGLVDNVSGWTGTFCAGGIDRNVAITSLVLTVGGTATFNAGTYVLYGVS